MEEIHLFIIWQNALNKKEEILADMEKSFEILAQYKIEWSKDKFSENLSRFYGTNLPAGSGKEQHCGNGPFLLIIVKDKAPKYETRATSKGDKTVNVNMFDKKTYYRELTGGGHKIHATNDPKETNHDITLLLGKNINDFLAQNLNSREIINLQQDLFGANGWEDVKDMFYALNNCIEYALLRNYEILPDEIYVNKHNDIDVICTSHIDCAYILNAKKVFQEEYRVHYVTQVKNNNAYFDLRYLGDGYYCKELEKNLIHNRIYNEKGFYTISNNEYIYTLLYHAILHKKEFADDYKKRLSQMTDILNTEMDINQYLKILENWMIENEYIVTIPEDISVQFNKQNAQKLSKLIYRNEEKLIKLKTENQNLKNENNKLSKEINELYNSKSWKATAILRKISGMLQKK